ncbi:MAG: SAM-dependent methyltransferase [Arcobacter sp.]|uniref:SAM-dependent methyltransferase n=1 Tax=Arcobacter sp. TaxID=1872629 RepID=UPI003B00F086
MKTKFSDYFNNWLYGKDGYYTKYKAIGKDGDFFTAVSTSMFFGGSIAKKIVDTISKKELPSNTTILEIGAHHGYLLADITQFIYTLNPKLLESLNFAIVERFEHLRVEQREYLKESFGDSIKVDFYSDISEVNLDDAFIVANEIYDAFACELIYTKEEKLQTAFVKNDKIEFEDCLDENIINRCKKYKITKGELALGYEEFAKNICTNIKSFHFLTFDYGEKYPRNDFSCRIYSKHEVFPIFEENIELDKLFKNSDITYDVNFSQVIDSFSNICKCEIEYQTQLKALVEFGILDLLEILQKNVSEENYLKEVQKVKTLIDPTGMGDRFKMLLIKK